MHNDQIQAVLQQFKNLPDEAGVSLPVTGYLINRSRASIYRDVKAGRLEAVKIGGSKRIKVGSIRKLQGEA